MRTIKLEEAPSADQTRSSRCATTHGKLRVVINRYLVAPTDRQADMHARPMVSLRSATGCYGATETVDSKVCRPPSVTTMSNLRDSNGRRGVTSGYLWLTECMVRYGGKEIRTETVDGNLLSPEEPNVFVRARPSQLHIQWILDFNPPLMELRLGEYFEGTQTEPTSQRDFRDPQALRLVQALKCDIDQGCPAGTVFVERIGAALSVYLAHRSNWNSPNGNVLGGRLASPRFTRVVEYIRAHLDRNIHIDELADAVGLSVFHFAKLFKRITGSSPHQYILHTRLERATELLRNTQLSLNEIALQAGFADQSHLTNVFRRINGVTPSRFRSQI